MNKLYPETEVLLTGLRRLLGDRDAIQNPDPGLLKVIYITV